MKNFILIIVVIALIGVGGYAFYNYVKRTTEESKLLSHRCPKCGRHNSVAPRHEVCYEQTKDTKRYLSVLCKVCWDELGTPEARLYYFKRYYDIIDRHGMAERGLWDKIKFAVEKE